MRLEIRTPGDLQTMELTGFARVAPEAGQIEVAGIYRALAAGSAVDNAARVVTQKMAENMGQGIAVVIERL